MRRLALDGAIDVAGPVLSSYEQVDIAALVEGVQTKSQAHLLVNGKGGPDRSLAQAIV